MLEPEWSTNWQKDLHRFCKYVVAQDKGMYPYAKNIIEHPMFMFTESTEHYDFYLNKYGLLEDIEKNLPGPKVKNMEDLKNIVLKISESESEDQKLIYSYLNKYYDLSHTNSCLEFSNFITEIITN